MRVLLDECVPRDFKGHLPGHECRTVPEAGLAGTKNGALLRAAVGRFDALVTVDAKLRHQQNLRNLPFGIVVLIAGGTRLQDIVPLAEGALSALARLRPGQVIEVGGS